MLFTKQLASLVFVPLIGLQLSTPVTQPQDIEVQKELTPQEYIIKYAQEYGVSKDVLYNIIRCESNFNQDAIGLAGEVTMAQFKPSTFDSQSKKLGEKLDIKDYRDAIKLTAYSLSIGDGRLWTTYRAITNGGTYTFVDKQGISHTSYCELKKITI